MNFIGERVELAVSVTKVAVKAGRGDVRFLTVEFAARLDNALAAKFPEVIQKEYLAMRRAMSVSEIKFTTVIASQNIDFRMLPSKDGGEVTYRLTGVNLFGLQLVTGNDDIFFCFSIKTQIDKPFWDFLFYGAYRDVFIHVSECQTQIPVSRGETEIVDVKITETTDQRKAREMRENPKTAPKGKAKAKGAGK